MNIEFFKKTAVATLSTAIVSSAMLISTTTTSQAVKTNNNIHINKSRLKQACKRSGGKFFSKGKRYGCTTSNTTISCNKKRNCSGTTW